MIVNPVRFASGAGAKTRIVKISTATVSSTVYYSDKDFNLTMVSLGMFQSAEIETVCGTALVAFGIPTSIQGLTLRRDFSGGAVYQVDAP